MQHTMDAGLRALRRKLDAWCLEHLRQHCAEQAARIEQLERELRDVEAIAEQWQREAEALRDDVATQGGTVQLHRDGTVNAAFGALQ